MVGARARWGGGAEMMVVGLRGDDGAAHQATITRGRQKGLPTTDNGVSSVGHVHHPSPSPSSRAGERQSGHGRKEQEQASSHSRKYDGPIQQWQWGQRQRQRAPLSEGRSTKKMEIFERAFLVIGNFNNLCPLLAFDS